MSATAEAVNRRLAIKAAIKRGSQAARARMNQLDRETLQALDQVYRRAADELVGLINGYADSAGSLRLETMQQLLQQSEQRLAQLSAARDQLMDGAVIEAASIAVNSYAEDPRVSAQLTRIADDAVRFVRNFVAADGLQLSDRLWRVDQNAAQIVGQSIQNAIIQGHSASRATRDFLDRGEPVPPDVASKVNAASAAGVGQVVAGQLLRADGNPRHAVMRVFRTELNRAHGEAYMAGGQEVDGFAGWRFLLSPRHPEQDICDMHARANVYGLGPGVYPTRDKVPWPAHPNTLSYVEIVFDDEISEQDKLGKTSRIDWLRGQPQRVQDAVLGSRAKRVALQRGILKQNEIATPWRVLKQRYASKGIDVDSLIPVAPPKLKPPLFQGQVSAELRQYTVDALKHAPNELHGIISNTRPLDSLTVQGGRGSYYLPGRIVLDPRSMKDRPGRSKFDVYRHEYGHHVDFFALSRTGGQRVTLTSDAAGGLATTMSRAKRSLVARSEQAKTRRKELAERVADLGDTGVADIFGSLTRNKVGWGHSNNYLSRYGNPETEVFANLFDLYGRKDRTGWDFVARELPDLTNNFENFIKKLGAV